MSKFSDRSEQWLQNSYQNWYVVEEAGLAKDGHEYHHAKEQAQGLNVEPWDHFLQRRSLSVKTICVNCIFQFMLSQTYVSDKCEASDGGGGTNHGRQRPIYNFKDY